MNIRPSSLPMLDACARWESNGGSEYADAGTARHAALSGLLRATRDPWSVTPETHPKIALDSLAEDEADAVRWAADYISCRAVSDQPLLCEQRIALVNEDLDEIIGGTPDVRCGRDLFDLKWRRRDYTAQMACYALMMFQQGAGEPITVHVLYGESKHAERFEITESAAREIVQRIMARAADESTAPTPCDYCGWCAKRLTCAAFTSVVKRVAEGYADASQLDLVRTWHPSQMESGEDVARGLTICRRIVSKWCDSMEHHALEAATKRGLTLPGYRVADESGGVYVADVAGAFAALALPQDEFLRACDVRMETSKSYPDKVGVVDLFGAFNGITKKAPAKRECLARLAGVLKDKKRKVYLKAEKTETER